MKALWSGDINFGLVTIPVKLFSAVQEKKVNFHLMSPDGKCRLHHKLVCNSTGKEFDFKDAVKGYERSPSEYVLFKKEELAVLRAEADPSLEILDFVPLSEIDPRYYDRPYFVAPDKRGIKSYKLLFAAMQETEKVAIARFVMRRKRYIAAIRPLETCLALSTLHYETELLDIGDVPRLDEMSRTMVSPKERELGIQLIEQMASHFTPKKYRNEDLTKVSDAIAAKSKASKAISRAKSTSTEDSKNAAPDNVIDLFDSLRRSIHGKGSTEKTKSKKQNTQRTSARKTKSKAKSAGETRKRGKTGARAG